MSQRDPLSEPAAQNPYSPSHEAPMLRAASDVSDVTSRGMVGHVQVLGVLMVVQGTLVVLMGIGLGFYAAFMPQFLQQMQRQGAQGGNAPQMPADFGFWITLVGGTLCVVVLVIGILMIIAGVRTIQFRSRTFSMVMLWTGLLTVMTCYCLPTQLLLTIYGLIVLLNAPVRDAFRLVAHGHDADQVRQTLTSLPK